LLAEAARWARQYDVLISALELAEARYERSGDRGHAARAALSLCREHFVRNNLAAAGGWLGRATRLLEGEAECAAHGYLRWTVGRAAWSEDNFEIALDCARDASEIGRRLRDVDLEALGLHDEGHVLIARGEVDAGRALIDEAAALSAGASNPVTTGTVYCGAIWAYRNMADWRRAGEWTDASLRWCERESLSGYPGLCRFHRAEVRRLRGDLDNAERDALDAIEELMPANLVAAGWALGELGEIRRRRGDLPGAREAFRQAHEIGGFPQPGLALLLLDEGKPDAALASIADALARMVGVRQEDLIWVLPAAVTIALAAGHVERANEALTELQARANDLRSTAASAAADGARGEVQLAAGDTVGAITSLRDACRSWCDVDAPFEAARTRVLIAQALRRSGDESNATVELETALGAFERLGASREAKRVRSIVKGAPRGRATRTLMFTDIVDSTKLVEVLGDDAWGSLLEWHDRTMRRCFDASHGHEVNHEGDGFFVSFTDPLLGVDCAIAIQRTLAEHRHEHGFAPQVRIGVHTAEAIELGDDYLGKGVHEAARVGAAAGPGEILASAAVLEAVEGLRPSDRNFRQLTLKGLATPLEVASIDWQ
jgi:class 3 adenylate cyclase